MKRVLYYKLSQYPDYLQKLVDRKANFTVSSTNYSRKISRFNTDVMFNEQGERDTDLLRLINKVRRDADNYIILDANALTDERYIHFFDLFNIPKTDEVICKIDVKGAYWNYALKSGIITEYTNEFFKDNFTFPTEEEWNKLDFKEKKKILKKHKLKKTCLYQQYEIVYNKANRRAKQSRLKALGSLATTKKIVEYKKGRRVQDLDQIVTQATKPLYMNVCRGVDKLMKECADNIPGCCYYYWDCMFVSEKFKNEVIDFMKDKEYDVSIKDTKLSYVSIGRSGYLVSSSDGKIYMTRKENKHLLDPTNYERITN